MRAQRDAPCIHQRRHFCRARFSDLSNGLCRVADASCCCMEECGGAALLHATPLAPMAELPELAAWAMPLHGTYTSGSATGTNCAGDRNTCERGTLDFSRPEPSTRLLGGL